MLQFLIFWQQDKKNATTAFLSLSRAKGNKVGNQLFIDERGGEKQYAEKETRIRIQGSLYPFPICKSGNR